MKRHRVVVLARALILLAGAYSAAIAGPASAQEAPVRAPRRLEAGVYAGGSWTNAWAEAKSSKIGIGANPVFGGFATAWLTPHIGARLHGAYVPSDFPEADGLERVHPAGRAVNIWLYDAALMLRPFAARAVLAPQLASAYGWIGVGAVTVDPAGDGAAEGGCVYPWTLGGGCLSYSPALGTVGQASAGVGADLFYIGSRFAVYTELGTHGYDSPFHTSGPVAPDAEQCDGPCDVRDRTAFTTRLVLGAKLGGWTVPPQPLPAVPPPPAPVVPVAPPAVERIQLCVLVDALPQYVEAVYRPASGDTVVMSSAGIERPLRAVYPAPSSSAAGQTWFVANEDIYIEGRPFVRFGIARTIAPGTLARTGDYQGVPTFRDREDTAAPPKVVYVPIGDGCLFQPYEQGEWVRRVRG